MRLLKINYALGRLAKNTVFGTLSLGIRAVIQAVYLLIVSRWLGAEGYGLFAGSVAFVILVAPLANWGSPLLLTRYIAENRNSSRAMWATALVQTGVIGSMLVIGMLAIMGVVLPQHLPLWPMLLIALSELILLPTAQAATSHCFALEKGGASAISICLVPIGRTLVMLSVIVAGFSGSPEYAALAHFIGSLLGFFVAIAVVTSIDGWPAWRERLSLREATRQGTPYAISNVAGAGYQEVDKVLMLQLLGAAIVGPYTVAFRVASIFVLPISALISATLPRLMANGAGGNVRTYRVVLLTALGYGLLASLGIIIIAPLVPQLFGEDYHEATSYLLLLAPWPALFALRQCLAAKLTATGRQHIRSITEVVGLVCIAVLNLVFLPRIGVNAAAWALIVTELGMALVFLAVMSRKSGKRYS